MTQEIPYLVSTWLNTVSQGMRGNDDMFLPGAAVMSPRKQKGKNSLILPLSNRYEELNKDRDNDSSSMEVLPRLSAYTLHQNCFHKEKTLLKIGPKFKECKGRR